MPRQLSPSFISGAFAQETDEVLVCLLTITHEDLALPLYLSSDPTTRLSENPLAYGTSSRGNMHLFLPFEFTLPDDMSDSPPRVQLSMDNTDRQLVALLRSISTPASIKVEIVLASDPDFVELTLPAMQLGDVTIEEGRISANLVADNLINEPHPAGSFTPGSFPGLF
jgi:hypothetical protein